MIHQPFDSSDAFEVPEGRSAAGGVAAVAEGCWTAEFGLTQHFNRALDAVFDGTQGLTDRVVQFHGDALTLRLLRRN